MSFEIMAILTVGTLLWWATTTVKYSIENTRKIDRQIEESNRRLKWLLYGGN